MVIRSVSNQCRVFNFDMFSRTDMFVCLNRQSDELSFFFYHFYSKLCFLINPKLFSIVYTVSLYIISITVSQLAPIGNAQ